MEPPDDIFGNQIVKNILCLRLFLISILLCATARKAQMLDKSDILERSVDDQ